MLKVRIIKYCEPILWAIGLLVLYFMDPGTGPSICLFRLAGMENCPGCGIGHSIHEALHFNFFAASAEHLLGIPATIFLLFRIVKLFFLSKSKLDGTATAYDAQGHSAG